MREDQKTEPACYSLQSRSSAQQRKWSVRICHGEPPELIASLPVKVIKSCYEAKIFTTTWYISFKNINLTIKYNIFLLSNKT